MAVCMYGRVLVVISLLACAYSQTLRFITNAGVGLYQFQYEETTESTGLPPPGSFNVRCVLDNGNSETITYAKTQGDQTIFQINSTTGELFLPVGEELDYEVATDYTIGVTCSAPSAFSAIAQVNFDVIPVNEFEPEINPASVIVITTETAAIGTILVSSDRSVGAQRTFTATDGDDGPDGVLRYSLLNENLTAYEVDTNTGTVTVIQPLDVDNIASGFTTRDISLTVCDINPPVPTCPTLRITIIVLPQNDNDPVFSEEVYQATVSESAPPGTSLLTVSCTDADVINGVFSHMNTSSTIFNVTSDPDEQTVFLVEELDFETVSSHTITLTCYDTGGLSATATLTVTVQPVNDISPVFDEDVYTFAMNRILTTGNVVGRVMATDGDLEVGNQLTYTLTGNDNFEIQADGAIILTDFIYIIEGQIFMLEVTASDGKFNDTATAMVTVNGVFSVPEIILICMGAVIFFVLVVFVIVCCCYCCVCCSRLIPKQRHVDVPRPVDVIPNEYAMVDGAMMMPMADFGFGHAKRPVMVGQVPQMESPWSPTSGEESEEEEKDVDVTSFATQSSRVYTPTPYLNQMVEKFKEGDEILQGKKKSKKK